MVLWWFIDGSLMVFGSDNMTLSISTKKGKLIFIPTVNDQDKIIWDCINGEGLTLAQLPSSCIRVEIK